MKRIGLSLVIVLMVALGVFAGDMIDIHSSTGTLPTIIVHPEPGYVILTEKDYEFLRAMVFTFYNTTQDLSVTFLTNRWGEESTRRKFIKDHKFIMDRIKKIDKYVQEQLK